MARDRRNGTKRADRGPDGRFAEGNPGGPGRPPGYARVFREVVNEDALAEVLRAVLARALDGDLRAAEVLLKRAVPELVEQAEPPQVIELPEDLSRLTDEELGRIMRAALTDPHEAVGGCG